MSWQPQDNYCVVFSDETAAHRDEEKLDEMVYRMRTIANEYGFDLSMWGGSTGITDLLSRMRE